MFSAVIGSSISEFDDLSKSKPVHIKDNSVLHVKLSDAIKERGAVEYNFFSREFDYEFGVSEILMGFESAAKDTKVKGLFLEIDGANCGYAALKEIRNGLEKFKSSGKPVIAYLSGEMITTKEYYLSSVANKVYGFPTSSMEFLGLGAEMTYYKNSMKKLDVEAEVIRGRNNDFKSAVEPFFRDKMSDSSRLQITTLLSNIWNEVKQDISNSRKITTDQLDQMADNFSIRRASDAVDYKLLDAVKYRDEVLNELSKTVGQNDEEEYLTSFIKYAKNEAKYDQKIIEKSSPNIAVILAEGGISVDGDEMTSIDICKQIRKARDNKSIKVIVLRVNSPGGSGFG